MAASDPADPARHPIARLIGWSAANPWLVLLLVAALGVWGWRSLRRTPLDAIPDLSDTQVIVFTEWPGASPTLVEDQVTYPLSTALLSTPRVEVVRGISAFGASWVYVLFAEGTDLYWARSRVMEALASATVPLPEGVRPQLGPDATSVGWVFQYALVDETGQHDLADLRALQDWTLRPALQSVAGVAEVAAVGGFVRELQVEVDPLRLRAYGVPFEHVARAVERASGVGGGMALELGGHEHMLRSGRYVTAAAELAEAPVMARPEGTPVRVADLAVLQEGPAARRGIAELDGRGEVVGGIVIMRQGENALAVIDGVKAALAGIALPPGVRVVPTYDRSELIEASIDTLRHTLLEEMLIVSAVIVLFLLHVRSALLPILTLPVAVLAAFVPMAAMGVTANIMSLGGIAVAIGAMVDAAVVIVENVHKRLGDEDPGTPEGRRAVVVRAMQEVGPSIFFALLVLTVAFLPVFALEGTEGRLFRPLAWTKTWSMAFASLLAVTAAPALGVLLIRGAVWPEERHPLNRRLVALYEPVVRTVVRRRWTVVGLAVVAVSTTIPPFLALEGEFMPPLDEGSLLYMPTAPPGISATEAATVLQVTDRAIREVPEVRSVFGKMGRADTATDPAPLGMAETVVTLAPRSEWRPGLDRDALLAELDAKLRIPGMPNVWWMPIQTRTEMLATGVRTPIGIQVLGADLDTVERTALRIQDLVATIPGTRSAFAERSTGGFYLDVDVDPFRAARYGLGVADVNDWVAMAVGGMPVSETIVGRARFPIAVRFARETREDPDALARLPLTTPTGAVVPLAEVAEIRHRRGPDMIRSEDGQLLGLVFVDPGDVPLATWVERARARLAEELVLPPGVRVGWTGQFEYYERANAKLAVLVPATLLVVFLLLYLNRGSLVETLIVLLAVPFSLVGAIWLVWALGYHLSVAVWVGLIALAGLDAETGVVMLLYLDLAHARAAREGRLRSIDELTEAIVEGAARRIRPKLMTVLCAMLGLLPILWSTGAGADVTKRIAAPMVGGLVSSFALELLVYPAVFAIWKARALPVSAR